jgi:hypothetical protein
MDESLQKFSESKNRLDALEAWGRAGTALVVSSVRHFKLLMVISGPGYSTFSTTLAIRVNVFCHLMSIGVVSWK